MNSRVPAEEPPYAIRAVKWADGTNNEASPKPGPKGTTRMLVSQPHPHLLGDQYGGIRGTGIPCPATRCARVFRCHPPHCSKTPSLAEPTSRDVTCSMCGLSRLSPVSENEKGHRVSAILFCPDKTDEPCCHAAPSILSTKTAQPKKNKLSGRCRPACHRLQGVGSVSVSTAPEQRADTGKRSGQSIQKLPEIPHRCNHEYLSRLMRHPHQRTPKP